VTAGTTTPALLDRLVALSVDKVIAGSRFVLAAGALAAIYFDPSQPARGDFGYLLLIAYVLFATAALILAARGVQKWPLLSHLVDVGLITGVMYYTEGPTSPYFVLFSFLLFSGTLQWEWGGAVATGALLVGLIVALSVFGIVDPFETGEADRLIMRATYLFVASALFAYVGAYLARARRRLVQLAVWPASAPARAPHPSLQAPLAHAAKVLGAGRALVIWEQRDEPYRFLALWGSGSDDFRSENPDRYGAIVGSSFQTDAFAFDRETGVVQTARGRHSRPDAIDRQLLKDYRIRNAVTMPFSGIRCRGRLFLLDVPEIDADDLSLGEIAAHRIQEELDRHSLEQEAEAAIKTNERVRVARDLHDGILQTLTAARLQLTNLDRPEAETPDARLQVVKDMLQREQQRIRAFVEAAERDTDATSSGVSPAPLAGLADDLASQWNCAVRLETDPVDLSLPAALGTGLRMMILEAVANAARHGLANRVDIKVARENGAIELSVTDDGCGLAALMSGPDDARASNAVPPPRSLRTRVEEFGGTISVASGSHGVSVHIRLPVS
jgi:signal transduction histidine kinase